MKPPHPCPTCGAALAMNEGITFDKDLGILSRDGYLGYIRLPKLQATLFGAMLKRNMLSRRAAWHELYGDRLECDQPTTQDVIDVAIMKMRRAVAKMGIKIVTIHAQGWKLSLQEPPTDSPHTQTN